MKKRLIALMCAGVIALTMSGCTEEVKTDKRIASEFEVPTEIALVKTNTNIVVEINNTATLHKGDVYAVDNFAGDEGNLGFNRLEFKCGKKLNCSYPFSFSDEMPSEDYYSEICENCFDLGN